MATTEKDIEHLAVLARLSLSAGEKAKLVGDLERILEYVGELSKIDTNKIEPMTGGTDLLNGMREDETRGESFPHKELLIDQAPEKEGRYVKVPRVLE